MKSVWRLHSHKRVSIVLRTHPKLGWIDHPPWAYVREKSDRKEEEPSAFRYGTLQSYEHYEPLTSAESDEWATFRAHEVLHKHYSEIQVLLLGTGPLTLYTASPQRILLQRLSGILRRNAETTTECTFHRRTVHGTLCSERCWKDYKRVAVGLTLILFGTHCWKRRMT